MTPFTHTVLITGGTTGLGYHCALHIAKQRPQYLVIIASRSNPDADVTINKSTKQSNVEYMKLDLSSLATVRSFATTYLSKTHPPIISLVLNAGSQFTGAVAYTDDGFEKTFAVNHIGHALLFYLLRSQLTPDARIVVVSSGTHDPAQKTGLPNAIYNSAEELAHPTPDSAKYSGHQRYATSKLCNVLWTYALSRRLLQAKSGMTVNAFDPGLMPGTGLARDAPWFVRFLWHHVLPATIPLLRLTVSKNIHTADESGFALARLAISEDVRGITGKYYEGLKQIPSSNDSYVEGKQDDLWEWTVKCVAKDEEERKLFETI